MGIGKAIEAAKTVARGFFESSDVVDQDLEMESLRGRIAELSEALKIEQRIGLEYFEVIERIEKERDQWKDMFFTQSSEHQNAQAILQKMLADCSANLRSSLRQLNFFRSGADLDPVSTPAMLESLPKDLPEKYGEKMRELAKSARPQTDGLSERAKISQKQRTSRIKKKS